MNERVLLVGNDHTVLETRALLLQFLETVKCASSEAKAMFCAQTFDVVVIGQSVEHPYAGWINAAALRLEKPPAIIAIRFPIEELAVSVEVHETNSWKDPGWLKERVTELISERNPSGPEFSIGSTTIGCQTC
jgi:hypothetical protein